MPLTAEQREGKARLEFEKAKVLLQEAEKLARWGQAPNACMHVAYFAMHHCAAASILMAGGIGRYLDVPKSHDHVIEHFAKLVHAESEQLVEAGRSLARAMQFRENADYGLVFSAVPEEARSATDAARYFIEACRSRWAPP